MVKLALKVQGVDDAMDLVPVSDRDCLEHTVADAIAGWTNWRTCESKFASSKNNQAQLSASRQAVAGFT